MHIWFYCALYLRVSIFLCVSLAGTRVFCWCICSLRNQSGRDSTDGGSSGEGGSGGGDLGGSEGSYVVPAI
jgi:hypothetical protein